MSNATATNRYAKSDSAFLRAQSLMPGGVSSPVRAYKSVNRNPIFIKEAAGCTVTDIDSNTYIDYVSSYGPHIVGHAHPAVVAAVTKAASKGSSFGMPSEAESVLAEKVVDAIPSLELVRFVNSGTEATMSAIRLARAATNRTKIIKAIGGYHGHVDSLLVQAGSGATTLGTPSSPGVPSSITSETLLVPYNDTPAIQQALADNPEQVAAIMIEPVAGNMGCVPPADRYLQSLRELCDQHGTLLIFDEVMTGFRVSYGGAQSLYNVTPDLTALGKIIGGGLPCAAYGGKESIMRQVSPDGPVYQAGTLSGNPIAMAAGIATLEILSEPGTYKQLDAAADRLATGLLNAAKQANLNISLNRVGSMLTPFFNPNPVTNYEQATASDTAAFTRFFTTMLDESITLPPSQFEAWFVSLAHDDESIDTTINAATKAFVSAAN